MARGLIGPIDSSGEDPGEMDEGERIASLMIGLKDSILHRRHLRALVSTLKGKGAARGGRNGG